MSTSPPPNSALLDTRDRLTARISQARALIAITHGETGEAFRMLSGDIQSDFMWAVSDMVDDISECVALLSTPDGRVSHE